MVNRG